MRPRHRAGGRTIAAASGVARVVEQVARERRLRVDARGDAHAHAAADLDEHRDRRRGSAPSCRRAGGSRRRPRTGGPGGATRWSAWRRSPRRSPRPTSRRCRSCAGSQAASARRAAPKYAATASNTGRSSSDAAALRVGALARGLVGSGRAAHSFMSLCACDRYVNRQRRRRIDAGVGPGTDGPPTVQRRGRPGDRDERARHSRLHPGAASHRPLARDRGARTARHDRRARRARARRQAPRADAAGRRRHRSTRERFRPTPTTT